MEIRLIILVITSIWFWKFYSITFIFYFQQHFFLTIQFCAGEGLKSFFPFFSLHHVIIFIKYQYAKKNFWQWR